MEDCPICASSVKSSACLPCRTCDYRACYKCYKTYAQAQCMNCSAQFTKAFLRQHLGVTFINSTIRKKAEATLLQRERALIPMTQPLADWERLRRTEQDKSRFGIYPEIPPKPVLDANQTFHSFFPCPIRQCRGFVSGSSCGVCHTAICPECREPKPPGHTCTRETVDTLKAILSSSRPCPRCGVPIHRTEGCNHMKCTHCKANWNWETGQLMNFTTNHHYDNVESFARNVVTREPLNQEQSQARPEEPEDMTSFTILYDRIRPDDQDPALHSSPLWHALYTDPQTVRLIKKSKYEERPLITKNKDALVDVRVKYMIEDITETKWVQRLYILETNLERDLHTARVLNLYLATVREYQNRLYRQLATIEALEKEWASFIAMCNESLNSLQAEYGGPQMRFRDMTESKEAPGLIII